MVTVLRDGGFRIVIYLDDHEPAHVHVIGDGEAKVNLASAGGDPELVWARGLTKADVRRAFRLVAEHHEMLLDKWSEIHG